MYTPKFALGQVVITPAAQSQLNHYDVVMGLHRHNSGDFGDVSENDKAANTEAMETADMILSAYTDRNSVAFWIITEGDRSATTILLPSER